MSKQQELKEISKYLKALGARWSIRQEEWVKEIIKSVLSRRSELLSLS